MAYRAGDGLERVPPGHGLGEEIDLGGLRAAGHEEHLLGSPMPTFIYAPAGTLLFMNATMAVRSGYGDAPMTVSLEAAATPLAIPSMQVTWLRLPLGAPRHNPRVSRPLSRSTGRSSSAPTHVDGE